MAWERLPFLLVKALIASVAVTVAVSVAVAMVAVSAGATCVPMHPELRATELQSYLQATRSDAVSSRSCPSSPAAVSAARTPSSTAANVARW